MNFLELFIIAVGLSMDAFAVAVTIGLTLKKSTINKAVIVGLYFGFFQGIMPLIGYIVAAQFADHVVQFSHWVVFVLLTFLGGKMIWGSFKKEKCTDRECPATACTDRECPNGNQEVPLTPKKMLPLALATSIDAMAVGVSFAFLYVRIVPAISIIGVITFIISMLGVKIGNIFGSRFKSKAELLGGLILTLMGAWVLIEKFLF